VYLFIANMTIRLTERDKKRFYKKMKTGEGGHWLWDGAKSKNRPHGSFTFSGSSSGPHNIAWVLEHDKQIPQNRILVAGCGVRECCRPDHQQLLTKELLISNANRGMRHGNNKLTIEQVIQIKTSLDSTKVLSGKFCVSRALVHAIRKSMAWRWVKTSPGRSC
jgi:hypothetical protein